MRKTIIVLEGSCNGLGRLVEWTRTSGFVRQSLSTCCEVEKGDKASLHAEDSGKRNMPGKRARRHFSQLSKFERGLIIGMKTAGWSTRHIAGQVDRSECAVRNCWEQWTREVIRSTIRADVCVAVVPQTISRHLAEENLKSKRPFRALPLTPEHRQLRLQWCQVRSMWNVTDWQKVVFSDESRFVWGTDDNRVRVWRHPGPFLNGLPGAIFQQDNARVHTARVAQDFLRHFQTIPWPARYPTNPLEANPQVNIETPLHPEKLTVSCALWAGGIIGPYFFKNDEGHNVTVNGDRYRAMITNFFIPELNNHDVQELWFQQDGTICHTARATVDLLKDTFSDRLISRFGPVNWPPRSCDLTPLDYFLWGYVKSLIYADTPQTLDHLEDNYRRVIADIRPQMLEKVIENWTSRLDYIRASRSSYMPKIIFKM
ncbi:transposable element Tc1 transposase [Trichonephila clavipes]|nr:transposable element Tc1 transposase [Trichonephila clavipes]